MAKFTVRLLGSVEVRDAAGRDSAALPCQPKRLGLLSYLATARPRGFHRRDKLVALFWPEASQEQARHSLSQALHILRSELGDAAVMGRGDSDVAIDEAAMSCDVVEFEQSLEDGEYETALELYRGDLLDGLFVRDAPEFEQWLDDERTRLREKAAGAAWALAHERIAAGRLVDAERTAQRALLLVATDETEVRRFIQALANAGDRAAAVRFYEKFARRLRSEYEIEPDPATVAVLETLATASERRHHEAQQSREASSSPQAGIVTPSVGATPAEARTAKTPSRQNRKLRIAVPAAVAIVAVAAGALLLPGRNGQALDPNRVLVVALEDESGRQETAALGKMAQAYIIDILTDAGFATVVDPITTVAVSQNVAAANVASGPEQVLALADEARAGTVVCGSYYTAGDSIRIQVRITDAVDGSVMASVGPLVGSIGALSELVTRLGQEIVTALAPLLDQQLGSWEPTARPATYEAYEAYAAGLEAYLQENSVEAAHRFERAVIADPTFYRAMLWAAQSYQLAGRHVEWSYYAKADSLIGRLVQSREHLTRHERCRLDFVIAIGPRLDLSAAYEAARCLAREAPGSEDAKRELAFFAYRFNRPAEAIDLLGELDPDRGLMKYCNCYWTILTHAYHMLGDYEGEVEAARRRLERSPEDPSLLWPEARALATLGRLDELAATLEVMLARPGPDVKGWLLGNVARYLWINGHHDAAQERFDEAIAWFQALPDTARGKRANTAFWLRFAGRWDEALPLYEELAEEYPENTEYLAALGMLAARRGDRAEALRISEQFRSIQDPSRESGATLTRAKIAALLGDRAEAMTLLQQAIDLGYNWGHGIWLYNDVDLQPLRDYPPFQEFLRPKG